MIGRGELLEVRGSTYFCALIRIMRYTITLRSPTVVDDGYRLSAPNELKELDIDSEK